MLSSVLAGGGSNGTHGASIQRSKRIAALIQPFIVVCIALSIPLLSGCGESGNAGTSSLSTSIFQTHFSTSSAATKSSTSAGAIIRTYVSPGVLTFRVLVKDGALKPLQLHSAQSKALYDGVAVTLSRLPSTNLAVQRQNLILGKAVEYADETSDAWQYTVHNPPSGSHTFSFSAQLAPGELIDGDVAYTVPEQDVQQATRAITDARTLSSQTKQDPPGL